MYMTPPHLSYLFRLSHFFRELAEPQSDQMLHCVTCDTTKDRSAGVREHQGVLAWNEWSCIQIQGQWKCRRGSKQIVSAPKMVKNNNMGNGISMELLVVGLAVLAVVVVAVVLLLCCFVTFITTWLSSLRKYFFFFSEYIRSPWSNRFCTNLSHSREIED